MTNTRCTGIVHCTVQYIYCYGQVRGGGQQPGQRDCCPDERGGRGEGGCKSGQVGLSSRRSFVYEQRYYFRL